MIDLVSAALDLNSEMPAMHRIAEVPVSIVGSSTGALGDLFLRGNNFCGPELLVDSLSIEDLTPVPVENSSWGGVKSLFQ